MDLGLAGVLEVSCMGETEGVELFLKIFKPRPPDLSDPEKLESDRLVIETHKELGGLPLALAQSAKFAKRARLSVAEYHKELHAQKLETLKLESRPGEKNAYSAFNIAIKRATPMATMLLKLISHLNHQDVPFKLLEDGQ